MNLYEILHISQDAPIEIIKLAYKGLAQKYHPDRYKGDDANEIMVRIREAYETLSDPEKRKKYDYFLAEQARRKQQQEEYVRKQQQEEFARSQRENFKREANSSAQSQTKEADSSEATKGFNINLSIKVPQNFSIFAPFIKLFEWLKSKKRVFIKVIAACFTLYLLALIGFVASNYAKNINSNKNQEQAAIVDAPVAAQETIDVAETAQDEAYMAAQEAMSAASEVVAAAEEAENFNEEIYSEESYRGPQDERLVISSKDVKNTSNLVFRTFKESGMTGVKRLVSDCYTKNAGYIKCVRLDFAGKYLNDSAIAAGLPEYEYFKDEAVLERIYQNFYSLHEYDAEIADGHALELMRKVYASMEQEII